MSDNLNTSYTDVLNLAYLDRVYLIKCINDKKEATAQALAEARQSNGR